MSIKHTLLFPVRKLFTFSPLTALLANLLKSNPSSRILRGICPNNSFFAASTKKTAERDGVLFELRLNDYMDWLLYFYSEADSSTPVLEYIKKDNIVLDIGGNIGQTALLMAKKTGAGGRVISFEPFPETYNQFLTNLRLNPAIQNITVENIALGDKQDILKMYAENNGNSGQNRILNEDKTGNGLIEVMAMPLNDYLEAKPLPAIDFIKIDVEGFEYKVLKGATGVISRYKPNLYIELSNANLKQQGSSANQVLDLLHELSYVAVDVSSGKQIRSLVAGHTDIFCSPSQHLN